jgi:RNA polymerase sigma factor (sigma-70 family)
MSPALALPPVTARDDKSLTAAVVSQAPRLKAFVRRQVADFAEAEDIVQEAFAELVTAFRVLEPIENVAGWLLRVARNRIIDRRRARTRRGHPVAVPAEGPGQEPERVLDEWLAPTDDGPEARYARAVLAAELAAALDELPPAQREVFVAHEIEGRTFKDLAAASGVGINTLLGRKHAAVRHLRTRLRAIYQELNE